MPEFSSREEAERLQKVREWVWPDKAKPKPEADLHVFEAKPADMETTEWLGKLMLAAHLEVAALKTEIVALRKDIGELKTLPDRIANKSLEGILALAKPQASRQGIPLRFKARPERKPWSALKVNLIWAAIAAAAILAFVIAHHV